MKDGPTLRGFFKQYYFCTDCRWFRETNMRYDVKTDCTHPKWDGPFPHRTLCGSNETPNWCPYITDKAGQLEAINAPES